MQTSDAYWFPVIGGGVLCSLYFAFKYLGPLWINRVLSAYFVLVGLGALAKVSCRISIWPMMLYSSTRRLMLTKSSWS